MAISTLSVHMNMMRKKSKTISTIAIFWSINEEGRYGGGRGVIMKGVFSQEESLQSLNSLKTSNFSRIGTAKP